MLLSDKERAELSLSSDRISVYACSISLTDEKEDLGVIQIITVQRALPWAPNKHSSKKLANQGTQILLTNRPHCKVRNPPKPNDLVELL